MIFLILLIIIIVLVVYIFNKMVRFNLRCDNSWSNIEIELKRRRDLIPNLVKVVNAYSKHECDTLIELMNARNNTVNQIAKNSDELTKGVKKIIALKEKYPDLKCNLEFNNLQIELVDTEDKISKNREFYNNCVERYNTAIEQFPTNIVANMMKYKKRQYFEIKEIDKEPIKVEL